MTDKVWDRIKEGQANVPVPGKSQYVTDEFIFTCPHCKKTISSVHYLSIGYFQIAAEEHFAECSKKQTPIIDADQDQRDQLTTRLSLRRDK